MDPVGTPPDRQIAVAPLLGSAGYRSDPAQVERVDGYFRFYHFTHAERLSAILRPNDGLRAFRRSPLPPKSSTPFVIEGLLEPNPGWMTDNEYFDSLGAELFSQYVGQVPLVVTFPIHFPNTWVADYAHAMECKFFARYSKSPLGLGYDCDSGRDAIRAMACSRVPIDQYQGGHIAPIVEVFAPSPEVIIPSPHIARL